MKAEVFPSVLSGQCLVPGSKSIAQRLMAAALLSQGESVIRNYPDSDDCVAVKNVIRALGAVVEEREKTIRIRGGFPNNDQHNIRNPKSELYCGESGLASRMFTPIVALSKEQITISGSGSLMSRPFIGFERTFQQLNVDFSSNAGKLPVTVQGPMHGGECIVDGSISSQFLTGFLMALPLAETSSHIQVPELKSIPYIDMTLEVLAMCGIACEHSNYRTFQIPGRQQYRPVNLAVPADWSAAAFILCAAAIASEDGVSIANLKSGSSSQADSMVLDVLRQSGALVYEDHRGITVRHHQIKPIECDLNHAPDLFPTLVALAAHAEGVSTFTGAKRLVHKESNRAKALQEEFLKANIRIVVRDDEMKVYPGHVRPAVVQAHHDHRIAMAASLLALKGDRITIQGAECVSKSFPDFFEALRMLGARVNTR
jgi:3-phosphoshikimate 1-carboxyvinyltransferase